MGHDIDFDPARVVEFLNGLEGLTGEDRSAVLSGVRAELGRDADKFLHLNPVGGEGWRFEYDYPHLQPASGVVYVLRFVCDGGLMRSHRRVRVLYVDYTTLGPGQDT